MNKPFNPFFQLNEQTKIGDVGHRSRDTRSGFVFDGNFIPWIGGQLFNTQRKTLVFFVDIENHRLYFLPLFIHLGRMFDPFGPAHIRNVNEPVYPFINSDKSPKIGNILDFPLNGGPHRIFFFDNIPRIRFNLLHAQ